AASSAADASAKRSVRPNATLSYAVSAYRMKSWKTTATFRPACSRSQSEVSTPFQRTRPASGMYKPARSLASVVFPDPLGPTSATTSPGMDGNRQIVERGAICAAVGERHVFGGDRPRFDRFRLSRD